MSRRKPSQTITPATLALLFDSDSMDSGSEARAFAEIAAVPNLAAPWLEGSGGHSIPTNRRQWVELAGRAGVGPEFVRGTVSPREVFALLMGAAARADVPGAGVAPGEPGTAEPGPKPAREPDETALDILQFLAESRRRELQPDIAKGSGHSEATVSRRVQGLNCAGLVSRQRGRGVEITERGRQFIMIRRPEAFTATRETGAVGADRLSQSA